MKLPKPRKIIAEKYVAGLSLFKSRRSPIKLSANESALGPSPKAVKSYSSIGKGFVRYPDSDGTFFRKVLAKKFRLKKDRIIFAYEPVWSIGTGLIPSKNELESNVNKINKLLFKRTKIKLPILYGGSVNVKNISSLRNIEGISGFLVGSASQSSKKFIDIIKKTIN